ncbi:hypothetical protein BDK51DRAFT_29033 [Blyttiomyces helicus]|uniref:Uncharacterized protein n=1 Tax=Blyttiomyces helicus TaxID=388810 RepID=A0A4P9WII2_9FUNG|nr:hypothetical protein BDK51DRAFT_29033 [Blyttiomyces helicus]|eukprot:RKO91248.1 hypothetical protein BDK51DRAFT_29033 [Blyttiomyces helicus]
MCLDRQARQKIDVKRLKTSLGEMYSQFQATQHQDQELLQPELLAAAAVNLLPANFGWKALGIYPAPFQAQSDNSSRMQEIAQYWLSFYSTDEMGGSEQFKHLVPGSLFGENAVLMYPALPICPPPPNPVLSTTPQTTSNKLAISFDVFSLGCGCWDTQQLLPFTQPLNILPPPPDPTHSFPSKQPNSPTRHSAPSHAKLLLIWSPLPRHAAPEHQPPTTIVIGATRKRVLLKRGHSQVRPIQVLSSEMILGQRGHRAEVTRARLIFMNRITSICAQQPLIPLTVNGVVVLHDSIIRLEPGKKIIFAYAASRYVVISNSVTALVKSRRGGRDYGMWTLVVATGPISGKEQGPMQNASSKFSDPYDSPVKNFNRNMHNLGYSPPPRCGGSGGQCLLEEGGPYSDSLRRQALSSNKNASDGVYPNKPSLSSTTARTPQPQRVSQMAVEELLQSKSLHSHYGLTNFTERLPGRHLDQLLGPQDSTIPSAPQPLPSEAAT